MKESVFRVCDEIVQRQIGDVRAILDLRTGTFYTLNETASLIWELIEKETVIEDICNCITHEYNVSRDEVIEDIRAFMEFFCKEQLLICQK